MARAQDNRLSMVESELNRRTFLKATVGTMAAASVGVLTQTPVMANHHLKPTSESLAAGLYKTLSAEQKKAIVFPFEHELRSKVGANWLITKPSIDTLFSADQQAMVREIFMSMHSEEYAEKVMQQVVDDSEGVGGFGYCAVAFFGEPGHEKGKSEFVLTGRHVTRRCDGNALEGTAFGGPIFYGHAGESFSEEAHHPGNIYWYQASRANEVFRMLDGEQRKNALIKTEPPREQGAKTVQVSGKDGARTGIPMTELSHDQKDLVRQVIGDVLAPFRKSDVAESLKLIEKAGFDNLSLAFYQQEDIGDDGVWDIWRIEGPSTVMYFRGAPHVHAWMQVKDIDTKKENKA